MQGVGDVAARMATATPLLALIRLLQTSQFMTFDFSHFDVLHDGPFNPELLPTYMTGIKK